MLADDNSTSPKLTSLRTKQCIVSCELSSNGGNAERFLFFLYMCSAVLEKRLLNGCLSVCDVC